jgi:hypothetical protein
MQRSNVAVCALILLVGLLGGNSMLLHPVRAQASVQNKTPAIDRPGDAMYTPTKLEWEACHARHSQMHYFVQFHAPTREQAPVHGELLNWAKIRCFFGF